MVELESGGIDISRVLPLFSFGAIYSDGGGKICKETFRSPFQSPISLTAEPIRSQIPQGDGLRAKGKSSYKPHPGGTSPVEP